MTIPLGVLNALVNGAIWVITSLCAFATERIYARVTSNQLQRHGLTRSTDASEVLPNAWLFGHLYSKKRRFPVRWALILLCLNFALLPLEILLEGGIDSSNRCRPYKHISKGVCAKPYDGHSESGISAAMLATQRFTWADPDWDYVLVGSSKIPRANEVRIDANLLSSDRSYLVRECIVKTAPCPKDQPCGNLTVIRTNGPYDTMVDNPSAPKGVTSRGDLTYDKSLGVAFHFWEVGTSKFPHKSSYSRKLIKVAGVETLLNESEINRVLNRSEVNNWTLVLNSSVTRLYEASCVTDGLLAKDLARAVSLFRTSQLEQPGVRRNDVGGELSKLAPLNASNVAMAAYAMKSEDWSDPCSGEIDLYRTCGTFKPSFVLPFVCLALVIVVAWLFLSAFIPRPSSTVPVDTGAWRKLALRAIRSQSGSTRSLDDRTLCSEDMFTGAHCAPSVTWARSLEETRRREAEEMAVIDAYMPQPPDPIGLGVRQEPVEYSYPRSYP